MPTRERLIAQFTECVNITRFLVPINLIRIDQRTGNIYVLAGNDLQFEILAIRYTLDIVKFQGLRLKIMKSQIGQWGNSLAVRIPKYVVEALDLKANDALECRVEDGRFILEPIPALSDLSLEELLAGIVEPPESEIDWGQPMGNEVW